MVINLVGLEITNTFPPTAHPGSCTWTELAAKLQICSVVDRGIFSGKMPGSEGRQGRTWPRPAKAGILFFMFHTDLFSLLESGVISPA